VRTHLDGFPLHSSFVSPKLLKILKPFKNSSFALISLVLLMEHNQQTFVNML